MSGRFAWARCRRCWSSGRTAEWRLLDAVRVCTQRALSYATHAPFCAVGGEVALPSYSDTCDLPIAFKLGRRSPAGTITFGTWVSIRVRRLGPADGRERYRDRRALPDGCGAGAVRRNPGSGLGPQWGAQAHGG